jgi:glycosyltransferase involved in cell wall biosynthesis
MKIAQICFPGLGGHSSVVFSLISADITKQHEWLIGFIGNEPVSKSNIYQCNSYSINYKGFIYKKKSRLVAWLDLFRWLKKSQPKFVICHSVTMLLPCLLYSALTLSRLIMVEHTPNSQKKLAEWIFGFLSMLFSRQVIILTQNYLQEIKHSYKCFFMPSKFTIVPNGIDANVFKKTKVKQADFYKHREIILGMAARFSENKKHNLLIEALDYLNTTQSNFKFKLSLAGNGTTLKNCMLLAKDKKIDSLVDFKGFLNEAELVDWFQGIDIYLHATDGETLSTSILQAMSCGLPIIASDIPGVSNLLNQEEIYGIISKNDVSSFSNKIIDLVNSPDKMRDISENAMLKASSDYSNTKMLESYISVLLR